MKRASKEGVSRKLVDHIASTIDVGPARGLLATTYELGPEFVETDFLPSLLGIPAWDDRRFRSRVQLEAELGRLDAAVFLMDAHVFRGRPRSLRVRVNPQRRTGGRGVLHAKVTLVVHDDAIRLLVGSANLTTSGYRENREVAAQILVDKKRRQHGALVRQALAAMPTLLSTWWVEDAQRVVDKAVALLDSWQAPRDAEDEWFLWGGGEAPLWREVASRWPEGDELRRITIVSPFWSDEGPDGPLARLLQGLRDHKARMEACDVLLVTAATPDTTLTVRPTLPDSYRTFDFRKLRTSVSAVAARPRVDEEDVGRDDVIRERPLHAKVVLLEGPKVSLTYFGSANFTFPGWGFGRPDLANVEAGVLIRRRGRDRDALRDLIPPLAGSPVALDGGGRIVLASPKMEDAGQPWPTFLLSAELRPVAGAAERLELALILSDDALPARWSVACDEAATPKVDDATGAPGTTTALELTSDELIVLLRRQTVVVRWTEAGIDASVAYPLNVSHAARENLPFGDPSALPNEDDLVSFYQGRIAFEDLFPGPGEEGEDATAKPGFGAAESVVDTSKILSYQIRNFVEALRGLAEELRRHTASEAGIRLALLGPVSPLALAREIEKAALAGRSPTAAAFQLTELAACARGARDHKVEPKLAPVWTQALLELEREIDAARGRVRSRCPELGSAFDRYAAAVLGEGG